MNDMTLTAALSKEIFKIDSTGRLRTWQYEVRGNEWRTHAGLIDGAKVTSGWTTCEPKSQNTGEGQAYFEGAAAMRHKLERTYHPTPESCGTPNFFEPMLAKDFNKAKDIKFPVYTQPKLDGIRCIARAEGLFTRQGKPITSCPHIERELAPLFLVDPDLILDGELYNHDLHEDFEQLVSIIRKQKPTADQLEKSRSLVEYHIYDIPSHDGVFALRSDDLRDLIGENRYLVFVDSFFVPNPAALNTYYEDFLNYGYEGQMVRLNEPYEQKRSKNLLKRKEFLDAEFEIVEVVEGNGSWAGYAKRITCKLPDGRTFGSGVKGTQAFCLELLNQKDFWIGKQVTIKYFTPTSDGIPRFPVAIKFHEGDKL